MIKNRSKVDLFWGYWLSFCCVTMKLGLHAYQKYFQVCVKHGLRGPYFRAFLDPRKGQKRSKLRFLAIFSKQFNCVTMKLDLQVYWRYFRVHIDQCPHVLYFRTLLDTQNGRKEVTVMVFGHFLKRVYCMTMKLGLQAYRRYFHICKSWPRGTVLELFFDRQNGSKFGFPSILQSVSIGFTWNVLYNSLELLIKVCKTRVPGPRGPSLKVQWD